MSVSVCLSVCSFVYLRNHTTELQISWACCLWLRLFPLLKFFRICEWRHVFSQWLWCVAYIYKRQEHYTATAKAVASVSTKFCSTIMINKYTYCGLCPEGEICRLRWPCLSLRKNAFVNIRLIDCVVCTCRAPPGECRVNEWFVS